MSQHQTGNITMPTLVDKDACQLLDADHIAVKHLFVEYARLAAAPAAAQEADRKPIAMKICAELTVHAQIEEEIFYPALREAMKASDLLDEAQVEHGTLKSLIAQLEAATDVDDLFDAKVKVLGEYVDHHVKEERNEIFVKARAARGLDLVGMREQLAARKEQLGEELSATAA
jgi:hypothetical protein